MSKTSRNKTQGVRKYIIRNLSDVSTNAAVTSFYRENGIEAPETSSQKTKIISENYWTEFKNFIQNFDKDKFLTDEEKSMINIAELKIGDKVCYQPEHYKKDNKYENGIVKEIPDHTNNSIRVVYNCANNWDDFMNYTSALTNIRDLTLGWKHE